MIALIIGRRGSGKTSLINQIIKNTKHKKILIIDYNYEYKVPHRKIEDLYNTDVFLNQRAIAISPEVEQFDLISGILLAKYKDVLFIIDELDIFDNPGANNIYFKRLLHIGRHKNIDVIGATRRAHAINRLFTSQTDTLYCFRTNEPRDLKYINDFTNNKKYTETIQKLKQYYYAVIKI